MPQVLDIAATENAITIEAADVNLQTLASQIVIEITEENVTTTFESTNVGLTIDATTTETIATAAEVQIVTVAEQGPVGAPGSGDGQTSNYVYGETISALMAVVIIDGEAFKADSSNAAHRGLACGVTVTAATAGNSGTVRFLGAMSDSSWNWTGPQLFVGTGGTLVESPPASGFSQAIARVESSDTIFINPFQPIERA